MDYIVHTVFDSEKTAMSRMQYVQCNPYSLICMYVVDRGMGITDQDDNDDDEEKDDDFD